MNHDLVHIVASDQAARGERRARAVFQGKVKETPDHPETILYSYLTVPRRAAPRWYHEGLAVFVETWMAGGVGRAQGSFDEMVFRSMVRDGTDFYDPVGLLSEGARADFQIDAVLHVRNAVHELPGLATLPRAAGELGRLRDDGTRGHYAAQFRKVFGEGLDDAWQEWITWEAQFS